MEQARVPSHAPASVTVSMSDKTESPHTHLQVSQCQCQTKQSPLTRICKCHSVNVRQNRVPSHAPASVTVSMSDKTESPHTHLQVSHNVTVTDKTTDSLHLTHLHLTECHMTLSSQAVCHCHRQQCDSITQVISHPNTTVNIYKVVFIIINTCVIYCI